MDHWKGLALGSEFRRSTQHISLPALGLSGGGGAVHHCEAVALHIAVKWIAPPSSPRSCTNQGFG